MSITKQDQMWLDKRGTLSNSEMEVIDAVFDELYCVSKFECVNIAGDDRAASLEAALVRFLIESREA